MTHRLWGPIVLMASLAIGCSKCGKAEQSATQVERMLPKMAIAVMVVPSVKNFGQRLRILETLKVAEFAGKLQGFETPKAFSDALVGQLGIDVRDPQALKTAGLDPERGLGVMLLPEDDVVVALPVGDERRIRAALEQISVQRFGSGAAGEIKTPQLTVNTFAPHAGETPRLAYVVKDGFALVATDRGVKHLAAVAALAEGDSLAKDEALSGALARVPAERLAFAYVPRGSPLVKKLPVTSVLATLRLSPAGLAMAIDAPWSGDAAQLEMFKLEASTSVYGYLPKDAFLTVRYQGDPSTLASLTDELLGPNVSRAFKEAGFDMKMEVLDQVKPGVVAALSLADKPPMDRGMPQLDLRTTNPFTYVHLSGAALVNSGGETLPVLEKIGAIAPKFGAQMSKVERNEQPMMFTTYRAGEGVHFAVKGDVVFFASPVQRIDQLETIDPKAAEEAVAPALLSNDAFSMFIDITKLANSVRELPASAWGLGGFAIKATTVRWLDATDDLKAITGSVGVKDHALQVNLSLVLAPKTQ